MADPIARALEQLIEMVERGERPPPSTVAALKRANGYMARFCAENEIDTYDLEKPYSELTHRMRPPTWDAEEDAPELA